eukprot:scaffold742_cov221-Chaetoceros_neogracile.AAC.3
MNFHVNKILCFFISFVVFQSLLPTDAEDQICTATNALECLNPATEEQERMLELILADDFESIDSSLPSSIREIKKRGGHRCWHKHNTFLDHLLGVHNILRLWGEDEIVARVGLFHSAYSNSYVNLALFDPTQNSERDVVRSTIGNQAEEIVHLFCIIDRQSVVVDTLLAQRFIPREGLDVPHLRDANITIHLTPEVLRLLVIFTMADVADQFFGWQDELFGGRDKINSMLLPGTDDVSQHNSEALWPGPSRPGLWMSYVSQLGMVANTYHDKETFRIPSVFLNCTQILSREMEAAAIELYWDVVSKNTLSSEDELDKLLMSSSLNPWYFECHVLLAQKYLHRNDNEMAKQAAERALELQLAWGTAYDKRMSFPAWVAWTRVLHKRAVEELGWPKNSWDVNNFGMVNLN